MPTGSSSNNKAVQESSEKDPLLAEKRENEKGDVDVNQPASTRPSAGGGDINYQTHLVDSSSGMYLPPLGSTSAPSPSRPIPTQTKSMHNLRANLPLNRPPKSYSVHADGHVSLLTPLQMGRHELYELVPFTAVFGLQKKERNLSRAFASYAAELDVLEYDQVEKHTQEEKENRRSRANLMLLDELEMERDVVTTPLIFAVLIAAMAQFLVGYSIGVMNAPAKVVFEGHSTFSWSLAVSAFAIGAPFGAYVGGNLADTRGRRGALLIATWTFLLGGIIQTCALDMFSIIVSRLIIGFASGFCSVLVPIYLGEMAPPTLRGMLGTLTQFAMVIGISVSNLLAFPFATVRLWRVLFSVTAIMAIVILLCSPFLLESPRYLLNKDPNSKKARLILKKLRGLRYESEIETEVNHFVCANKAQQDDHNDDADNDNNHKGVAPTEPKSNSTIMEMLYDEKVRFLFLSCLILQMAQQLSGINAVFYYSNMFFDGIIENPLLGTTIVGAINVLATYIALLLMDSCGRRTLILWSSGGMLICCILIVLSLKHVFPNTVALISVNLYVSFFEIGLGPIPWLIVAEMFDLKYVSAAMSASTQLNFACNFIVGLVFPYMVEYLGAFSFVPFAFVLLLTFVFSWVWLPETHGTTPEELQAQLVRKNSAMTYHNMNIEGNVFGNPIDLEWRLAMDQIRKDEEAAMKEGRYNYGFQHINQVQPISQEPPPVKTNAQSDWQMMMGGKVP